jgi:uncharacterized protein (TIGR03066 family)
MKRLHGLLLGFVVVLGQAACDKGTGTNGTATGRGSEPNKDAASANKETILGTWELMSPQGPTGRLFEFTRDGKLIVTEKNVKLEYEYEVIGDTLKQTMKQTIKQKELSETVSFHIKTLTPTDMVIVRGNKMEETYKKK